MATKTENGNVTLAIPSTNLILVRGGGIETLTCTSKEGLTRDDVLGYEAWLRAQPGYIYNGPSPSNRDRPLSEKARKMEQFLKDHPIPPELLTSRE